MFLKPLAVLALLLLVAVPTASAEAEEATDSPECWISSGEHNVASTIRVHDACLVPCPDHTCSSVPPLPVGSRSP